MPNSPIINSERSVVLAPPPKLPSPSHLPQKPGTTLIVDRYLRQKKLDIHDNHFWPALRQGRGGRLGLRAARDGVRVATGPAATAWLLRSKWRWSIRSAAGDGSAARRGRRCPGPPPGRREPRRRAESWWRTPPPGRPRP